MLVFNPGRLRPKRFRQGGSVEFVMFEDVQGQEVFVNPTRVMWVREYGNQNTEISCGGHDKFTVRLSPAQAVAVLGISVR
jgi:hypothetical protein